MDQQNTEFEEHVGVPKIGTKSYNWQNNQMNSKKADGLDAKTAKEIEENEGGTVWSDRKIDLRDALHKES